MFSNPVERGHFFHARNVALISFGAFIWSIYLAVQGQFLNDYLLDLQQFSPLIISLLVSLVSLTGAIVSVFTSSLSDRLHLAFGRRKLFITIGGSTSALLLLLLPLNYSLLFIFTLNVLMSVFNTAAFVCNNSLIPDITSKKRLGRVNAIASFGSSIGTIAGFALMLLSDSSVFYVSGAICLFGFLVLGLFFQEPVPQEPFTKQPFQWRVLLDFSVLKEPHYLPYLLSYFFLHLGINCYLPFLLIFLTQQNNPSSGESIGLGLSTQNGEVLIVFTVMTLISLVSTPLIGLAVDKVHAGKFLVLSRVSFAVTTAVITLTPLLGRTRPLLIGTLFIIPFGLSNTADIISRSAFAHKLVPEKDRGRLLSILFLAKTFAQIPGVIIGGLVAHFFQRGYQYSFLISGFFLLLSVPFLLVANRFAFPQIETGQHAATPPTGC
ncbi:hypothetical protein DRO91_04565 [Candidatus Heimdallarchaeota archaeon]|nr:MAG: hypothetical protein DRP02_02870 [Candidatus Gerdarchaeota archaeon]RLI72420.1 MAG: hypothetical protein DRO91_04565 [Candidatus Heimdallarchaeota archaeon]